MKLKGKKIEIKKKTKPLIKKGREGTTITYSLPEINIYPNNRFGDIARSQGLETARNWRKVKEGTTAGINKFGKSINSGLDIVTDFLPGIGDAKDASEIINGINNGDYTGAFVGALGFIPIIGDAAQITLKPFKNKITNEINILYKSYLPNKKKLESVIREGNEIGKPGAYKTAYDDNDNVIKILHTGYPNYTSLRKAVKEELKFNNIPGSVPLKYEGVLKAAGHKYPVFSQRKVFGLNNKGASDELIKGAEKAMNYNMSINGFTRVNRNNTMYRDYDKLDRFGQILEQIRDLHSGNYSSLESKIIDGNFHSNVR